MLVNQNKKSIQVLKSLNGVPYTETRSFSELETEHGTIVQKMKIK